MTKRERQLAKLFGDALDLANQASDELEVAATEIVGLKEELQQVSSEKAQMLRTGMDEKAWFIHAENELLRRELNKHGAYFPDLKASDRSVPPERKLSLLDKVRLLFRR
jgi:hypothetical protein